MKKEKSKNIIILGAGLAGTLMAIRLAQRGHQIELYEKRPDLRSADISAGRSINLALSDRGLKALRMVGLEDKAKSLVIPMHGRLIHPIDGPTKLYKYSGRSNEWINSISRPGLNALLLNEAEKHANITLHFDAAAEKIDTSANKIIFSQAYGPKEIDVADKLVIGADGAGSALRKSYQKRSNEIRFNFSQTFLDTGYKELCLPSGKNGSYQIEKNALHIWPRDGFMMIALPNLDGSFTVTLFMPFEGDNGFDALNDDTKIQRFFEDNFPDVIDFFPDLIEQFHSNPSSSLGTIRCYPWLLSKKYLLLGDACHAIVPFYGQGMNCAFEDCVVLDEYISRYADDWPAIFDAYQKERKIDADAIATLAEDNFYEMRDATADPVFNKKRQIELRMESEYPQYYSKYSLVTFREELPYHKALAKGRAQDKLLMEIAAGVEDVASVDLEAILRKLETL
jgi:kynurenine 3-monooxygenase